MCYKIVCRNGVGTVGSSVGSVVGTVVNNVGTVTSIMEILNFDLFNANSPFLCVLQQFLQPILQKILQFLHRSYRLSDSTCYCAIMESSRALALSILHQLPGQEPLQRLMNRKVAAQMHIQIRVNKRHRAFI